MAPTILVHHPGCVGPVSIVIPVPVSTHQRLGGSTLLSPIVTVPGALVILWSGLVSIHALVS